MRSRRIWVVAALGALVCLGLAFYVFYVVGPEAAIQRKEAFAFRRMTVAQLAGQGGYRFHYVTNRASEDDSGDPTSSFGRERGDVLHFGYFDTSIEPTLGLGMLVDPSKWFRDEEIRIQHVASLERGVFVERMRELVDASRDRSLLVVVHGFRDAFDSALRKTAFLGHVLDINAPVLVFDWPGNQGSSLSGYRRARAVAEASGPDLAETLALVIREIRPERLWLVANSMGGQVVAEAFGLLYERADWADAEPEIEDVVLTAPDIARDEFDERFEHELGAIADEVTVYVSSNDRALLVSRLVNSGRRLGESSVQPDQLEEAVAFSELVEGEGGGVTLVDVTPVNRTRNFHNFSLETPEFFDDLYLRLGNPETPRHRLIYPVSGADGRIYWVLTRGR